MGLKFTALKIKNGDAFLLQDGEWNCLFDSGGNQDTIKHIIKQDKKIKSINLAICSHNDSDHSHGFIGLLKLRTFPINEIWLPELWCAIVNYVIVNRNNNVLWSEIEDYLYDYNDDERNERWADYDIDSLFGEEFTYSDQLDEQLTHIDEVDITTQKNNPQACAFIQFIRKCSSKTVVDKLNNIIRIVSLALNKKVKNKGCKIVWFKNVKTPCCKANDSFVPLNSIPVCVTNHGVSHILWRRIPNLISAHKFVHATTLSAVNHYSLVFEYWKQEKPIVRFSADSDCDCQIYKPYPDSIIITAPHHGSDSNANVYTSIQGKDITWVRTYNSNVNYPYKAFFANCSLMYCVRCPKKGIFDEVCFDYKKGKWKKTAGAKCKK